MKKLSIKLGVLATIGVAVLAGCGVPKVEESTSKKEIVYGKGIGPYSELFEEAIIPVLEEQGYTFKYTEMDLAQADAALISGDVDVSVEQHRAYMEAFNAQTGGELVALSKIPTVPASIFSEKHTSLEAISQDMVIAVPQDAGNQARAYVMLQDIGWLTLKEGTNLATASVEDIASNPYNLSFYELQTQYIATSLADFDYGVITGSVVYNAEIDPSTALFNEHLTENFWLQVVVNKGQEDTDWAKAIVAAYQSPTFLQWLEENNEAKYQKLWSIPTYE